MLLRSGCRVKERANEVAIVSPAKASVLVVKFFLKIETAINIAISTIKETIETHIKLDDASSSITVKTDKKL